MVQQLSSRERAFLRKLAHNIEPIVRKILQNSSVELDRESASEIAKDTKSIFVDKIGNVLIFFKPKNSKDAVITPEFNEFKKKKNKK